MNRSLRLTAATVFLASAMTTACIDDDGAYEADDGGKPRVDASVDREDDASVDREDDARVEADANQEQHDAAFPPDAAPDADPVADTWGYSSAKRLFSFERASGRIVESWTVSGVPEGETLLGLDIRPADGALFALSSAGKLYTIDMESGAATLKAPLAADAADTSDPFLALSGAVFGVDFNPVADRLRVVSDTGQSLRINPNTGATITDTALSPATPGVTAAAYTENFASACRTRLLVIDAAARKLLLQNPPNDGKLSELASIDGASFTALRGFDIFTGSDGTNTALVAGAKADGEYVATLDLTTGAIRDAQQLELDADETLEAVVVRPPATPPAQAPGELLATTEDGRVISFNRAAPGKLCTSAQITGLASGEELLGADVRPADGAFYALSNHNKLYTIAVESGAAALKSTLAADPADATEPFSTLSGAKFGVGFNPVPDRLRVISDGGSNLRINVDTGATTTDVALNPGSPSVTAVAYTNSFAGAKSTTLYALDTALDALVRVGGDPATGAACSEATNPNCGVVTAIGALNAGGDVTPINGFDIDGRAGAALAALSLGHATTSTLFSVDLATGAASLPAGVANGTIGGGARLRSLSFAAAPKLTLWAATADNRLLSFSPVAPGTALKNLPISGLQASESVIGIDIRPLDGKLYAVGTSGRLYTLDTTSGAASEVATLSPAIGSAFTCLPAQTFGMDFNPAADALRLVDAAAENFRVLPSARAAGAAGATFVDTALNPAAAAVAAGYTNNFAGTSVTTLFVIDGAAGTLNLQGGVNGTPSPNAGALSVVGALGVTAVGDVGFDIAGGHNGVALAALSTDASTPALYSVNLATGAASPFNAMDNDITDAGDAPLRGLAIELK